MFSTRSEQQAGVPERLAVVGVGYVGIALAVAAVNAGFRVVGYDIDERKLSQLRSGIDPTGTFKTDELITERLEFTSDPAFLAGISCFVITVPTPLGYDRSPNLGHLTGACRQVARQLSPGSLVIIESTVYPGVTRQVCKPILERESGLTCDKDFLLAYSPERINPGDRQHSVRTVDKLVAGHDRVALARAAGFYRRLIHSGVHEMPSIETAELAKTVENSQRDLNVAFANEVARICHLMGLDTSTVLDACATKWNFHNYRPGMVGGHCLPIDSQYLIRQSEAMGYRPTLLMGARQTNDLFPKFIADQIARQLARLDKPITETRVAIMGATYKADVPDVRNSGVVDLFRELCVFGVNPMVHDVLLPDEVVQQAFSVAPANRAALYDLDMLVLAVGHQNYRSWIPELLENVLPGGIFVDLAGMVKRDEVPDKISYWRI